MLLVRGPGRVWVQSHKATPHGSGGNGDARGGGGRRRRGGGGGGVQIDGLLGNCVGALFAVVFFALFFGTLSYVAYLSFYGDGEWVQQGGGLGRAFVRMLSYTRFGFIDPVGRLIEKAPPTGFGNSATLFDPSPCDHLGFLRVTIILDTRHLGFQHSFSFLLWFRYHTSFNSSTHTHLYYVKAPGRGAGCPTRAAAAAAAGRTGPGRHTLADTSETAGSCPHPHPLTRFI